MQKKRARYRIELSSHYEKHYLLNNTITCALRKLMKNFLCYTYYKFRAKLIFIDFFFENRINYWASSFIITNLYPFPCTLNIFTSLSLPR